MVALLWEYEGINQTVTNLPVEPCEFGKHFEKDKYEELFQDVDTNDFRCFDSSNVNLSLYYKKETWSGSYIIVYLTSCTNSTENNNYCLPQSEIDKQMNEGSYYFSIFLKQLK